jgi:hypothetical protein
MDFSFGIITNGNGYIESIIESINRLNIPNYEILVVGTYSSNDNRVRVIDSNTPFIGIKKNMVTENAIYENVVYLHDYISFSPDWYNGFLNFGNDFDVCMNKIVNVDSSRYRDWCLWSDDAYNFVTPLNYLLPYEISHLSKMMYISGAYWVAKKSFMLNNPINTALKWGQGEDVEWSLRVREKTEFDPIETYSLIREDLKTTYSRCTPRYVKGFLRLLDEEFPEKNKTYLVFNFIKSKT